MQDFPVNGILPKKETGSLAFQSKYPSYDGRGIIIAILDTGVDPGAPGLQFTSDSKPKIIDLIDATGAGNVDISTIVTVTTDGYVTGLTGRKLKIPSQWSNPSGKYRIGIKPLFDLCPTQLKARLLKERKEKLWSPSNDQAILFVNKKLKDLKLSATTTTTNSDANTSSNVSHVTSTTDMQKPSGESGNGDYINILIKEDWQAQSEVLKDLENKFKDTGPIYDCLVWEDESKTWRACVDTSEKGDLSVCTVLTNFRDSHQYGTFSYTDMLNYTVRILPQENTLQIVTDSSTHGTHVASIAAGYYNESENGTNGVAPGAQIVSIKIGDNRINGMETGFSLANACRYVIKYKCDLVNYSFGEPINFCHWGSALNMVEELSQKYGVIFVGSAGNNGPGIETVDAPGSFSSSSIGVGAYVTSDMIKAEHSLLHGNNGNNSAAKNMLFTWSSRGPHLDGYLGVSVCAPGGAFASVPNWTQRGTQLMSGTSMSSPNCCGCLALILSGLKQRSIEFNPFGVKRAIENTAVCVDEVLGSGAGLIQVEKAFDYLVEYKESIFQKISFSIAHKAKSMTYRGIYLKNHDEVTQTRDYSIEIEPIFFDDEHKRLLFDDTSSVTARLESAFSLDNQELLSRQKEKISLNRRLALVCDDPSVTWLEIPSHLYIVNGSRSFFVRIRAGELEEGQCHFTQIKAFDLEDPKRACLFKIPITIVKPIVFADAKNSFELEFKNVGFRQGQIWRHFVRAPHGATHAEIRLNNDVKDEERDHAPLFCVQTFTLDQFRTQHEASKEEMFRLNATNEFKFLCKVQPNKIIQICIAKNWSSIGQMTANYKIRFSGLSVKNDLNCLSTHPLEIQVGSYLRSEECEIAVQYKHFVQALKPTDSQIDMVRPSLGLIKPIYQIVLSYSFHQNKTNDVCCECPLLSHNLYDNEYQCAFWMLFEANTKQFMLAGDCFPILYKYSRSLDKGDYIVRLHVRHERIDLLEKLKDVMLHVRHTPSASTPLTQDVYGSMQAILKGAGGIKKGAVERIQKNSEKSFFLAPIPDDKLPKGIANGNFLIGEVTLFKDGAINQVDNHRILYQINNYGGAKKSDKTTEKASKSSDNNTSNSSSNASAMLVSSTTISNGSDIIGESNGSVAASSINKSKSKTDDEKLSEAIRDIKVAHILKSNEIFDSLKSEHEDHVPIYLNRIQYLEQQLEAEKDREKRSVIYKEIIDMCRIGLEKINQSDLLRYFGEKSHDPSLDEKKKEFETKKNWVVDLLVSQGVAHIDACSNNYMLVNKPENVSDVDVDYDEINLSNSLIFDEVKSIYVAIQKWIDINDEKCAKFTLKFYSSLKMYGKMLKILFKQMEEGKMTQAQSSEKAIFKVFKKMNLRHAQKYLENSLLMKYQKQYASF